MELSDDMLVLLIDKGNNCLSIIAGYYRLVTGELGSVVMNAREEAPGQLEQVRLFVNTLDREKAIERLPDAASVGAWLTEHGLAHGEVRATAGDLNRATQLREALRQTLLAHNEGDLAPQEAAAVLDAAAARARVRLRFDAGT